MSNENEKKEDLELAGMGEETLSEEVQPLSPVDFLQCLIDITDTFEDFMDTQRAVNTTKSIFLPLLEREEDRKWFADFMEAVFGEESESAQRLEQDPETIADKALLDSQEKETLLNQCYRRPEALSLINTKTTKVLFSPEYQDRIGEMMEIIVSGKQQKQEIIVQTQLFISVQDDDGVQLPQSLTPYDRMVYDAVCTALANNKDMIVTTRQIYEAYAGKGTTSPQALGHVTRSMNKMRNTTIYLDCTQHVKSKNSQIDKAVYDENLLSFSRISFMSNGQATTGYIFHTTPVLYRYATMVNQIISVDRTLLNVETISNTDNNNLIKTYLLRRIEAMKNERNGISSNRILYETMLNELDLQTQDRTERKRIRDSVTAILEYWEKRKYIKGFSEFKERKKIAGVEIDP